MRRLAAVMDLTGDDGGEGHEVDLTRDDDHCSGLDALFPVKKKKKVTTMEGDRRDERDK